MKKIVLLLVTLLMLGGCSNSAAVREKTPEQAVESALNAVKNLDRETMQQYFDYEALFETDNEGTESNALNEEEGLILLVKNLSFKTAPASIEGDQATVKTEISNIDMQAIFAEYFSQLIPLAFSNAFAENPASEEELDQQAEQMILDLLKKQDNEMLTSTVDIQLTKSEHDWKINMDSVLQDALLGGLKSASDALNESLNELGS